MKNSYYTILLLLVMVLMVMPQLTSAQMNSHSLLSHSISEGAKEQKADKGIPLEKALSILEEKFGVHFLYRSYLLEQKMITDVEVVYQDRELSDILQNLLKGSDLTYRQISHRTIGITPEKSVEELVNVYQETVRGTVIDAQTGSTLPGVNIIVKGTTTGTATDANGEFELTVPSLNETLIVSYIGYATLEVAIDGRVDINISLEQSGIVAGEVVVTALGIQRERRKLGYSVQTLSPENLISAPDENIINSLGGKIAGVQTVSGGSTVGSSSRITIRGQASISGNRPLYVVDGVPIDNTTATPAVTGGTDWGDVVNDLNYENIESVTVLKGPSAAALYGNRASDGVILIETIKGPTGGRNYQIDYNSSIVFDRASYFHDYQNEYGTGQRGSEFEYQRWLANNPGGNLTYNEYAKKYSFNYVDGMGGGVNESSTSWGPRLDDGLRLDQWSTGPDSPWISRSDNINNYFDTGQTLKNNLAFSMQGDGYLGRISVSNEDIKGIIYNTDQSQKTISGSFTLQPTDRVTVSTNLTLLNRKSDNLPNVGYSSDMVTHNWRGRDFDVEHMRSTFEQYGNAEEHWAFPNGNNMYYVLENNTGFSRDRVYGNMRLRYDITDWLSSTVRAGLDLYNENRKSITRSGMRHMQRRGSGGAFDTSDRRNQEINVDAILEAHRQLTADIRIDGLVGANYRRDEFRSQGLGASNLVIPDLFTISNIDGTPSVNMFISERESNSVYASIDGSFRDYIFLGVTARNDWSSTLPKENRSYFYPSVNLGFSVMEAFNIESDIVNHIQLRSSWSKVGGDTGPYQLHRTYAGRSGFGTVSMFEGGATSPPVSLKPEETDAIEIGTEVRFLNDRFSIDATYYKQTTSNHILSVPVSRATGYGSMRFNAAEIENRGVELIVNGNIFQASGIGGFRWDMTVNWAKNTNMVNSLTGDLEAIVIASGQGGNTTRAIPGEEWGVIWGLGYVRNDNGDVIIGNNGVPLISPEPGIRGNVNPEWRGGIQNTFRFKGFALNTLVDAQWGGSFWSVAANQGWPNGSSSITVKDNVRETGIIVEGVKQDGSPNDMRISAQDYFSGGWVWGNNEYPIIDATYVKLREVSLGYDIGVRNIDWLQNARITVFGRNLAILHRHKSADLYGIDPEVVIGGGDGGFGFENHQWPTTRTFGVSINLSY